MPKVKYIASLKEIPAEQKYVLVVYGEEHAQTKHLLDRADVFLVLVVDIQADHVSRSS